MNNDGILDSAQADVTTYNNPVVNAYVSTSVSGDCHQINAVSYPVETDFKMQDENHDYFIGFHGVEVGCGVIGGTVQITHYWDKEYDTSNWDYRKYLLNENRYVDFNDQVTYGSADIGGKRVTTVTFSIMDGGPYDSDGEANGEIVDPVGPTIRVIAADETASIESEIWFDENGDGEWDKDEKGLDDIHVKLWWAGEDGKLHTEDDRTWKTKTNKKGKYEFTDLPAGEYVLKVDEDDVEDLVQTYETGKNMNDQIQFSLKEGEEYKDAYFAYSNKELKLAKTGSNLSSLLLMVTLGLGVLVITKKQLIK